MSSKEYGGQSIHFYRGAIDAAFREAEVFDQSLGLNVHEGERSRFYHRLKQLDMLVTAIEQDERTKQEGESC